MISNYKFSLCYENSITPGYHTEKLLHGKIAGNIPIYYGDETVCKDFNPKSFINTVNMSDEEVIETIKQIDTNKELYDTINSEPLFENKISLEPLIKNLYKILK